MRAQRTAYRDHLPAPSNAAMAIQKTPTADHHPPPETGECELANERPPLATTPSSETGRLRAQRDALRADTLSPASSNGGMQRLKKPPHQPGAGLTLADLSQGFQRPWRTGLRRRNTLTDPQSPSATDRLTADSVPVRRLRMTHAHRPDTSRIVTALVVFPRRRLNVVNPQSNRRLPQLNDGRSIGWSDWPHPAARPDQSTR